MSKQNCETTKCIHHLLRTPGTITRHNSRVSVNKSNTELQEGKIGHPLRHQR